MNNKYVIPWCIDIVYVIDSSSSMSGHMELVRQSVIQNSECVYQEVYKTKRPLKDYRIRLLTFKDYIACQKKHVTPMLGTPFFNYPEEENIFLTALNSIQTCPCGGGAENGLEALAYAIRSDWTKKATNVLRRSFIVLYSDSPAHELNFAQASECYPKDMAKDLAELRSWWGDPYEGTTLSESQNAYMDNESKRLVLFTPEAEPWTTIAREWMNVIHVATRENQYADGLGSLLQSEECTLAHLIVKDLQK